MKTKSKSHGKVGILVEEVLEFLGRPRSEDVILRVFNAIKNNPRFRRRYDELVDAETRRAGGEAKRVINAQIGRSTSQLTGMKSQHKRAEAKNSIVATYSLLE